MGVDPTSLKVYCLTPDLCGDEENHPNYEGTVLSREYAIELIPLSEPLEIRDRIEERFSPDIVEILERTVNGTISFKPTPAIVMHLLKLSQIHGFPSANSVAIAVMEDVIKEKNLDDTELKFCSWDIRKKRNFHKVDEDEILSKSVTPPNLNKEVIRKEAPERKTIKKKVEEKGDKFLL